MFFSKPRPAVHLEFDEGKPQTGLSVVYDEAPDESSHLAIVGGSRALEISFLPDRIDEAHILYMEATEILYSRAKAGENGVRIEDILRKLFAKYQH
ncbi:MAG: hypothetical protein ACREGH_04385 [Minisyncoccia bacterium]